MFLCTRSTSPMHSSDNQLDKHAQHKLLSLLTRLHISLHRSGLVVRCLLALFEILRHMIWYNHSNFHRVPIYNQSWLCIRRRCILLFPFCFQCILRHHKLLFVGFLWFLFAPHLRKIYCSFPSAQILPKHSFLDMDCSYRLEIDLMVLHMVDLRLLR